MNKLQNRKNIYITIAILTLVLIGIGYAVITSNLTISGTTNVKKNTWDVHFENVEKLQGSVNSTINITDDTTINYSATLQHLGDYLEFTVDVVNKGSFDAMITSLSNTGLTTTQQKYLKYTVTYDSGVEITEKQILKKETGKEKIRVRVEYKSGLDESDLPASTSGLSLTFTVNYGEAENAVAITHPTCKRATILHTEICNSTLSHTAYSCRDKFNKGDIMTFGNLGTVGTLVVGDAFDCDVNGDGEYNPNTERFYYLKDLSTNSNYGVLIYYVNVSEGMPVDGSSIAYDSDNNPRENGPKTAVTQLPTTSQWKKVSLSNKIRKIKDELGVEYLDFSYNGYAGRLPSFDDLSVCANNTSSVNLSRNCLFLLEKTSYRYSAQGDYWLEDIRSDNTGTGVYYVWGLFARVSSTNIESIGVRPVIEVEKSKISY
ncbi:MAG: hypothetical protein IJF92_04905 [Bacilli bacterium]|nr:hypothetical protein [Bacilli bacterium]